MRQLFKQRDLLIVGLAEAVSGLGTWVTAMAMFALIVFQQGGGVQASSGIFLASMVPMLLFSPIAGWLSDRYDRKWLMIISEALAGIVVAGLIVAPSIGWIYALLAVQSFCTTLMLPARQAAVPLLVPKELLTQANALLQQLTGVLKILGPMLAGLLLTVLTPHQAVIVDVISYGVSALILLRLPALKATAAAATAEANAAQPAERAPATAPRRSVLAVIRSSPLLLLLFVSTFLMLIVIMGFDVFSSVITRDILGGDEGFFGLMIGLVGAGSALATLWLLLKGGSQRPWRDLLIGMLALASIPMAVPLAISLQSPMLARGAMLLACVVGGAGSGLAVVQLQTLLQTLTPPAYLGRVSGVFQSVMVFGQLIALLAVPLLVPRLISTTLYFSAATLAIMLVVLGTALVLRGQTLRAPLAVEA